MQLPKTLLVGLVFPSILILQLIPTRSTATQHNLATVIARPTAAYKQAAVQQNVVMGLPVRLTIPKIDVVASIEHVGLTANEEMGTPKNPYSAAWYKFGPSPGENGSAVIDGHYGMANGKPAVFDNLYKLQTGDKLYVEGEKGTTITFIVRKLQTYSHDDDSKGVFTSSDGKSHLNLITCAGAWDNVNRNYSNRIVVFTDRE